jgi:amino-acid N-acetyltransferase
MSQPMLIRARPQLLPAVALLKTHGLPAADLTFDHLEHFFFACSGQSLVGLVGLEIHGTDALLRSLVVAESQRGQGLGSRLVHHAERHAAQQEVRSVYLLTMTAEDFFARRGYGRIERTQAPLAIQRTREFEALCPASSVFMMKMIRGDS